MIQKSESKPGCRSGRAREGTRIEMSPKGEKAYRLDEMLARITPENRHPEWDTGPAQGKEKW